VTTLRVNIKINRLNNMLIGYFSFVIIIMFIFFVKMSILFYLLLSMTKTSTFFYGSNIDFGDRKIEKR